MNRRLLVGPLLVALLVAGCQAGVAPTDAPTQVGAATPAPTAVTAPPTDDTTGPETPTDEPTAEPTPVPTAEPTVALAEPAKSLSPASIVKRAVQAAFDGNSNENKPYLRGVDVIRQEGGGWGVFVQFNADDNLTNGLTKTGIELQMRDAYKAIYAAGVDVRTASMAAWLDVVDQYGNTSEAMVYKTILDGKVARKLNWSNAEGLDWPTLWDTTILYPFLTK